MTLKAISEDNLNADIDNDCCPDEVADHAETLRTAFQVNFAGINAKHPLPLAQMLSLQTSVYSGAPYALRK